MWRIRWPEELLDGGITKCSCFGVVFRVYFFLFRSAQFRQADSGGLFACLSAQVFVHITKIQPGKCPVFVLGPLPEFFAMDPLRETPR